MEKKTKQQIIRRLDRAMQENQHHTQYLNEDERLVENWPSDTVSKKLPKVCDGTLAGIIWKKPVRVMPTEIWAEVFCHNEPVRIILEHILNNEILENDLGEMSRLDKDQLIIRRAETLGVQPIHIKYGSRKDETTVYYDLPDIRDTFMESGQTHFSDCSYVFVRTYYTPAQLQLIYDEQMRHGEDSQWDLPMLKKLIKDGQARSNRATREAGQDFLTDTDYDAVSELIQLFWYYQKGLDERGKGKECFIFSRHPDQQGQNQVNILKRWRNEHPQGAMPVVFHYSRVSNIGAYGKSLPQLVGHLQNVLDASLQYVGYNQKKLLDPMIMVRGNDIDVDNITAGDGTIIQTADETAEIKPVALSDAPITQYTPLSASLRGLMHSIAGTADPSVSAQSGVPGFSKTAAGVRFQKEEVGLSDHEARERIERTMVAVFNIALHYYLALPAYSRVYSLDFDDFHRIQQLQPKWVDDPEKLTVRVDMKYLKKYINEFSATTIIDTSWREDINARASGLLEVIGMAAENPTVKKIIGEKGVRNLLIEFLKTLGTGFIQDFMADPGTEEEGEDEVSLEAVQQMIKQAFAEKQKTDPKLELVKNIDKLGSDTARALLQEHGLPAEEPTPAEQQRDTENLKLSVDLAKDPEAYPRFKNIAQEITAPALAQIQQEASLENQKQLYQDIGVQDPNFIGQKIAESEAGADSDEIAQDTLNQIEKERNV